MQNIRAVKIGKVIMGGGFPVSVQTMWKEKLAAIDDAVIARIGRLEALGCDLLRFAVPDLEAAETLGGLAALVQMPLVADIHFDWRIALRCLDFPIAKIRINPGNIGARWKVEEVLTKARDRGAPIRIGVNAGSLPEDLRARPDRAAAIVEAAERELAVFEAFGFGDVVVSMKASDVPTTLEVNRLFAARHDYPLHLGVTEAGPLIAGVVKNTAALVPLLREGLGATIRVSLSDSMESEVLAAREILSCAGLARPGISIVSCPRCGRASFDTHAFTARWAERLYALGKTATVAVMGCVVNGPGEARHADLGITGAGDKVVIFRRGEIVRTIDPKDADTVFAEELEKLE
ncbi:MAG TPA: flavodoxin-dependent (E)-4-hydroxy-3-methylbut-2-enyl-diphosphate synthase [Rectinemataceae bacterium]|nr:flavodoxin-dependent (E)-4-hydroxy-3-methylbut-2-enyl-diphosphate synthase [Rectinemataceae bacterium]